MDACHRQQPVEIAGRQEHVVVDEAHVVPLLGRFSRLQASSIKVALAFGGKAQHVPAVGLQPGSSPSPLQSKSTTRQGRG